MLPAEYQQSRPSKEGKDAGRGALDNATSYIMQSGRRESALNGPNARKSSESIRSGSRN